MNERSLMVAAAVALAAAVGAGFSYAGATGARAELEARLARLEAGEAPAKPPKAAASAPGRDAERAVSELSARVRTLENELRRLEGDRERLLAEQSKLRAMIASRTSGPIAAREPYQQPPGMPPVPPPQPPMDVSDAWGAAEQSEMDELSAAVGFTEEQREKAYVIIRAGQDEFNARLIELRQGGHQDVIREVERIGDECYRKTYAQLFDLCTPEQRPRFQAYMQKKESGE